MRCAHRPELAESRINLTNTEISNKAIRSALLPTVDLFAYYGGAGLGGNPESYLICAVEQGNLLWLHNIHTPAPSVGYGATLESAN